MASENETIADIFCKKRERAKEIRANLSCVPVRRDDQIAEAEELEHDAARLEAAWEREREELDKRISDLEAYAKLWTGRADELRLKCDEFYAKAKPVCNAAATREALVKCREIALQWQADEAAGVAGTTDKPSARSAAEAVIDMEFEINAALSDPARNCDRFADETDAQIVFLNEVCLISVTKETALECDRFENWTDEMRTRYGRWLFAPAAERKGATA